MNQALRETANGDEHTGDRLHESSKHIGVSEKRGDDRPILSSESQAIVNILKAELRCNKYCVIPEEAQPHVSQHYGIFKEEGDQDIARGLDKFRELFKWGRGVKRIWNNAKEKALQTIVVLLVGAVMMWIAMGFLEKIRAGM